MGKCSTVENYYDILNLRTDCSDKDIKTAYVQLSKKFHPDVKGVKTDSQQTARFLKVSEAYQTLSKPKLRTEYDKNLQNAQFMRAYETSTTRNNDITRQPWEIKPDFDRNPGPYYGIKGLNRTTNSKVALVLIAVGIFAATIGFTSVKNSFSLNQKRMDLITTRAREHHQKILSDAEKYTKDEQLQRLVDRFSKSS